MTNELTKTQKRAAILISGAFRGNAGAALDVELRLLPMKLQLQQTIEEAAIRVLTGPQWACPRTAKEARRPNTTAPRRVGSDRDNRLESTQAEQRSLGGETGIRPCTVGGQDHLRD